MNEPAPTTYLGQLLILCNIDNDPTSLAKKISEWLTQGTGAKQAE